MCCSARTATIVFSILTIIGGFYELFSPLFKGWLFIISGIYDIPLGILGCYAVCNNKYKLIRIYAYGQILTLLYGIVQIIVILVKQEDIRLLFEIKCRQEPNNSEQDCLYWAQSFFYILIICLIAGCALNLWIIFAAFTAARTIERSRITQTVGFNNA